jgi:hypothetical protein
VTEGSADQRAAVYLNFAEREAHGRSALYEALARGVADDVRTLFVLANFHEPSSSQTCFSQR